MKVVFSVLFSILMVSLLQAEDLNIEVIKNKPSVGADLTLPISRQSVGFNEANGRIFYLPVSLKGKTEIVITIWGAGDNSGDGGCVWRVMDSAMKTTFKETLAKRDKKQTWRVSEIRSSNIVVVLEDKDTKFTGKYPGNPFEIEVKFPAG